MWAEASSVLHELRWRKEISDRPATTALGRLSGARVSPRRPKGLIDEAWLIADRLGWAKTYDAEHVALARILKCRLLTTDSKLRSAAARIGPGEL
jgi:predicted nucleic acid-binding protein